MKNPPQSFQSVFERLRDILERHASGFAVCANTADHYGLQAPVGPATLKAWHGKMRNPVIPVAWIKIEKSYVSFHLMAVYGNPKLLDGCSADLLARMQGKSCFNFKTIGEPLFKELETLTARSLTGMKKLGFVS